MLAQEVPMAPVVMVAMVRAFRAMGTRNLGGEEVRRRMRGKEKIV